MNEPETSRAAATLGLRGARGCFLPSPEARGSRYGVVAGTWLRGLRPETRAPPPENKEGPV
ncbi:hypothetical protein I79_007944 [Cricetulus griseus]|uniref:Uncharacterized protein n=1 Tax=Cricetulus griseus TaxID=10029 RepID=G3HBP0_CRIGR|nr:hypothetical protein I79_007944 [Cricetulus griseus]